MAWETFSRKSIHSFHYPWQHCWGWKESDTGPERVLTALLITIYWLAGQKQNWTKAKLKSLFFIKGYFFNTIARKKIIVIVLRERYVFVALPGGIHIGRRWSEAIGWKARDDLCYKAYIGLLWWSVKTSSKKRLFFADIFCCGLYDAGRRKM